MRLKYSIEYLIEMQNQYAKLSNIDTSNFVYGSGKRKTQLQRNYEKLSEYIKRLKSYAKHISICGENRNSYSKTDNDTTFMRIKTDYMGNDQLLPAYNLQIGICDEYIAVADIKQYASDMDCFVPLMEKFNSTYGFYPTYPVADAGYGSFNNYLYSRPLRGNKFGRTEEYYQCEDCNNCEHREQCHKSEKNRIVRINEELTGFHIEVLNNLNCIHGALLRMNRSIQAEGTYGIIKSDRGYNRIRRRGLKSVIFEFMTICCGFNLYKCHLKKQKAAKIAA